MPSDYRKVTLLILFNDKTWQERDCQFMMPVEATDEEVNRHAIYATLNNLAATGDVEKVYTVGVVAGTQDVTVEFKEKKKNGS
jgi:hypothetical protein